MKDLIFSFSFFDPVLVFTQRSEAKLAESETESETELDAETSHEEYSDRNVWLFTDPVNEMGGVRTIIVFTDLPVHIEFRVGPTPILSPGSEIVFEQMVVRDKATKRSRIIEGPYLIKRRILKYGSRPGLAGFTQYLEIEPTVK